MPYLTGKSRFGAASFFWGAIKPVNITTPLAINFQGNEGDCVVQPIRDVDGDELQIIDFDLSAAQLLGQAPIQVVNPDSADPKLQVTQVLPGTGHRISATFSDGLSEPQTVSINLILRSLSGAVDCWTD